MYLSPRFAPRGAFGGLAGGYYAHRRLSQRRGQEGSYALLEQLLQGFRDDIAMLEDGCILFTFVRMKSKPRHYTIHEEYVDEEAHQAHRKTEHYALWWNAILAQIHRMKIESFEVAEEIEPAGR